MKNLQKGPLIISGNAHKDLSKDIAKYIGQDLTKSEVFKFINAVSYTHLRAHET